MPNIKPAIVVTGGYLYSDKSYVLIHSPITRTSFDTCLYFNYHMRSENSGKLKVNLIAINGTANVSSPPQNLFEVLGSKDDGDIWYRAKIDLLPGIFVIEFEAIGFLSQTGLPAAIAIDDVYLANKSCPSQGKLCKSFNEFYMQHN